MCNLMARNQKRRLMMMKRCRPAVVSGRKGGDSGEMNVEGWWSLPH